MKPLFVIAKAMENAPLAAMLSAVCFLASFAASAEVGRDKNPQYCDHARPGDDITQCRIKNNSSLLMIAAARSGKCNSFGSTTVFESDNDVVVKTKDTIHFLSPNVAACHSYTDVNDLKNSLAISSKNRELAMAAMDCFDNVDAGDGCDKILLKYSAADCKFSLACRNCEGIVSDINERLRKQRPSTTTEVPGYNASPAK